MTLKSLTVNQASGKKDGFDIVKVRALIADHLDVDVKRVTDEAHFTDDLGADWLDRIELMILIEDEFAGVEITDDDADQIEVVGDLIRYIANEDTAGAVSTPRPHRAYVTGRGRPAVVPFSISPGVTGASSFFVIVFSCQ